MVEYQQIPPQLAGFLQIESPQPLYDLPYHRRIKPGTNQQAAEGVDIASHRNPAEQGRFDNGSAPPHEGVINQVVFTRQAVDKKAGQLGLKAGPVGDLVQRMSRPLFRGPEFVNINRYVERRVGEFEQPGLFTKFIERGYRGVQLFGRQGPVTFLPAGIQSLSTHLLTSPTIKTPV